MLEKVSYGGWPNCLKLSNDHVELVVTTDVGPRIISFAQKQGRNIFKEFDDQMGLTGGDQWRIYGGHRLWHAPEISPRTYAPDNTAVEYIWNDPVCTITQPVEPTTGIAKQLDISLDTQSPSVYLRHTLTNHNLWSVQFAPWALTVMAPDCRAIVPQEPYRPHPDYLAPARPVVLWHYTDMSDPRWHWGRRFIQLTQDTRAQSKQKIGVLNTLGWLACTFADQTFFKCFIPPDPGAAYPDMGVNNEIFTDPDILEVETLGPLTTLAPGASVEHDETWYLLPESLPVAEDKLSEVMPSLLKKKVYTSNTYHQMMSDYENDLIY